MKRGGALPLLAAMTLLTAACTAPATSHNTNNDGQEGMRPAPGDVSVADYHQILTGLDYSRIPPVSELAVYELFLGPTTAPYIPDVEDYMLEWGENSRSEFHLDGRHRHVSVSYDGVCTIRQDGTPACWILREQPDPHWRNLVNEFDYSLNRATLSGERFTEIQLVASRDRKNAESSKLFACALSVSGAIRCWGSNQHGELDVPENRYQQLNVASQYACGLTVQREAICWGVGERNFSKGAGNLQPLGKLNRLSTGQYDCGLTTDLSVSCWTRTLQFDGDFAQKEWGYESGWRDHGSEYENLYRRYFWGVEFARRDLSYGFDGGVFYQDVVSGDGVCGLEFSGAISCLDEHFDRRDRSSRYTSFGDRSRYLEDRLAGREDFERLALFGRREGPYRSFLLDGLSRCGILEGGGLECWGGSRNGTAVAPEGGFTQVSINVHIVAGYATVCGVRDDLRVVCWGWLWPEWRQDPPRGMRVLSVDEG